MKRAVSALVLLAFSAFSQTRSRVADYALVLEDPPVAQKAQSRVALQSAEAQSLLQKIRSVQKIVLARLAQHKVRVVSTSQILVNAIFVSTTRETARELKNLPGVRYVQYLPPATRDLNAAANLVNVSKAYGAIPGGASNAGAGIKIGIIDTGIDQNHPGFQDSSLTPPSGFPKGDSGFTNNKVIVARSYVSLVGAGFTTNPVETSRPDDNSPRDRVGHGTGIAMIAAGVQNTGPAGTIQGIAPKAFLGNYKIFGSPGVNDFTNAAAITQALTDALNDGMDVVTLSINEGDPAFFGPFDVDPDPNYCGGPCDVRTQAVESAVKNGMVVVTSAGNTGGPIGLLPVTLGTVHTPGSAPSGITVGASTNAHLVYQAVHVSGSGVPSGLQNVKALFGDGPHIPAPLAAPVRDVAQLQNDGLACSALPAGSLTGAIALIQRGTCFFSDKINFAQNAGAVGVIVYQSSGRDDILNILQGAQNTGIPAIIIGNTDGIALKAFLASNSGATASLDPALAAAGSTSDTVAVFSSRGPAIGLFANAADVARAIKPELVAPGDSIYTATQKFDPTGDAYNASGYAAFSGTSYAVPFVAGAVALVKQKNPTLTPAQLKSAVVNTATQNVTDGGVTARVNAVGAGKLSIGDAVNVAATLEPATLAFGQLTTPTVSASLALTVTNVSSSSATFNFGAQQRDSDSNARVQVSPSSLTVAPGKSNSVSVTLQGSLPRPGNYEGFIVVTSAGPALRVPYQYLVSDNVPANVFAINGGSFLGYPNSSGWGVAMRLVDQYGIPLVSKPANFTVTQGMATITGGDQQTYLYGIAGANIDLGSDTGDQIFKGTAGGLSLEFDGFSRQLPTIPTSGVVSAANPQAGQGMAPGSYISIYGSVLSDATAFVRTLSLPVSLASISISFDGGGLSLPGHIHFVSPGQINVQIPWEFQGQSSVQMKVTMADFLWSDIYTVPLAAYSPGVFATTDANGVVIGQANPARRGGTIIVYANGLGPVDRPIVSGDPTPSTLPLTNTRVSPAVTIGGSTAPVAFSGLTPGSVGLYQLNVVVPADAPTGTEQMKISIGGIDCVVNLPVQ